MLCVAWGLASGRARRLAQLDEDERTKPLIDEGDEALDRSIDRQALLLLEDRARSAPPSSRNVRSSRASRTFASVGASASSVARSRTSSSAAASVLFSRSARYSFAPTPSAPGGASSCSCSRSASRTGPVRRPMRTFSLRGARARGRGSLVDERAGRRRGDCEDVVELGEVAEHHVGPQPVEREVGPLGDEVALALPVSRMVPASASSCFQSAPWPTKRCTTPTRCARRGARDRGAGRGRGAARGHGAP